ncbi:MAG: VCBS repeat-containing protein [Chitinophagaceae bacterium]
MKNEISRFIFLVFTCVCAALVFSCKELKKNKTHKDVSNASIAEGKVLASKYCQSCHLLPDPAQLNAVAWENGVLPAMGPRLGIFAYGFQKYPSYRNDKDAPAGYYPATPVINTVQWQHIIDYYTSLSPDTLPAQPIHDTIRNNLPIFAARQATYGYPDAATCFTKIDTGRHQLFVFDMVKKSIFRFDTTLQLLDSVRTDATITDISFHNDTMLACNVNIINPNNGKFGNTRLVRTNKGGHLQIDSTALFNDLRRPVQLNACDLNNDGKTDYLVCEFGHLAGGLSWMENKGAGNYSAHMLRAEPGVIKAWVQDVNKDGLEDIWALFTQGNESIVLFVNKGNGQFDQQQVLRFPAIYGSTYFELADFNNDGLPDILYTCGDNADFSIVLKPYHGVYIFLNDGNNHFKQKYFYPINGCYKAMARDFDGDGDLDIACIAFSADFAAQPEEGFVYLENKGGNVFKPATLPEAQTGRWLTMDAGDLDGDGKPDIVLGNFSVRPADVQQHANWQQGPPFLLLKNISK